MKQMILKLITIEHSWSNEAHLLFIDQPFGVGLKLHRI